MYAGNPSFVNHNCSDTSVSWRSHLNTGSQHAFVFILMHAYRYLLKMSTNPHAYCEHPVGNLLSISRMACNSDNLISAVCRLKL